MSEYPYMHVSSKLKDFLDKIPSTGIPDKVTYNELTARGFKSTNDRSILSVLKYLTLVDSEGVPTEHWNAYRNRSNNKSLMATLIRNAYSELFSTYPEAQERTDEDLRNFVASKTKVGEDTIQRIVTTFRMLCSLADFSIPNAQADVHLEEQEPRSEHTPDDIIRLSESRGLAEKATSPVQSSLAPIHVNIHIHLPETDNVEAADALIKSVARHILGRQTEEES